MRIKILDCTLRDGGYYTNWDFNQDLAAQYFKAFNNLPVDYLEIGYRSNPQREYLGEYFYCPVYVLENARSISKKKLAVMLNEKDVQPEAVDRLLAPCRGLVDLIRIAVDPQHLLRALKVAEAVKQMGFEVAFNVMYMSKWKKDPRFLDGLGQIDGIADYLYIVDSYGGVYPSDVKDTINLVKERTSCPLGFHGHNNMELALINSLTARDHGAAIIDSTVTGMGRGAGNLKTELLLVSLSTESNLKIDFNALGQVVDGFEKLRKEHEWGTNLPYMISGANSLPQKDVMDWVTHRSYSFNSIIQALQNQHQGVEDNEKLGEFKASARKETAVIIGGGPNAALHHKAIKEFIGRKESICIIHASSKNAAQYADAKVDQYFCLVGNEGHRLERIFDNLSAFRGKGVLPPYPRKMGTYVPQSLRSKCQELAAITFTDQLKDSHTVLALQTALETGARTIYLVGYDGYQDSTITQLEKQLSEENEMTFKTFTAHTKIPLKALTPTNYHGVEINSVYAELI